MVVVLVRNDVEKSHGVELDALNMLDELMSLLIATHKVVKPPTLKNVRGCEISRHFTECLQALRLLGSGAIQCCENEPKTAGGAPCNLHYSHGHGRYCWK